MADEPALPAFDASDLPPEIFVKNTFIDCDDAPPETLDLRRCVTDSAQVSTGGPLNPSDFPPGPPLEPQPAIPESSEKEEDTDDDDDAPQTPVAMTRATTRENWESKYQWSWAFDQDVGPPVMAAGGYGGQPGQTYMQPMMPVPMMMMPVGDPNQQVMPQMVMGPDGQPMQMIGVPMRGMRWPDDMPPQQMGGMGGPPDAGNPMQQPVGGMPPSASTGAPGPVHDHVEVKETSADEPPPPQTLTRAFSVGSGAFRINWTVSATKLRSADKNAVSPPFELSFGGQHSSTKFKLMLFPKVSSEGKGGSSFRKAKGKGFIQLKCEADLHEVAGTLKFRLFVGSQPPRGPVTHDFSHSAVKGLPKDLETWDLEKSVTSGYFVVGAEVIPRGGW